MQILEVALDVFAEKGFHGARSADIAERAGISEALIFRHFETKEALYKEAMQHLFYDHPIDEEFAGIPKDADPAEVFKKLALHSLQHTREDPRIIRLHIIWVLDKMQHGAGLPGEGEADAAVERQLAAFIAEKVEQGVFATRDPRMAAKLFIYHMFMASADRNVGLTTDPPQHSDEELAEIIVETFMNGLKER